MATLKELLAKIGLEDREISVLLSLYQSSPQNPSSLARQTGIHRSTIYTVTKSLLARGLVTEEKQPSSVFYFAGSPEDFEQMVRTEEKQLQQKYQTSEEIAQRLSDRAEEQVAQPTIRRVTGDSVQEYLFAHAKRWDKSAERRDKCWWGYQSAEFIDNHLDWLDWLWQKVHMRTHVKLFSDTRNTEVLLKKKYSRRQIKHIGTNHFTSTTWVVGDFIIHVDTSGEEPILLELEHAVVAQNHRAVFQALWSKV